MKLLFILTLLACDDTWFVAPPGAGGGDAGGDVGGATAGYHPDGYAESAQHGAAAKSSGASCVVYHGGDVTGEGAALSCGDYH